MVTSSPSKAERKAAKRASEIKQGKQREFQEDIAAEVEQPQLEVQQPVVDTSSSSTKLWPYVRLSESAGSTKSLPAVFSQDGRFCFLASGAHVKIYSVSSCQLLSSLNLPDVPSPAGKEGQITQNSVTGLFLNPLNSLQLLTTSLDGLVRFWDYLDGRALRTIDLGGPISLACISQRDVSEEKHADHIYAGVLKQSERSVGLSTIVYQVAIGKKEAPRRRLGKCKGATLMQVSKDGRHLVILGRRKIHIAVLPEGPKEEASFVSFDAFPSARYNRHTASVYFTALSIHPTESYFATGDSKGVIRYWFLLDRESLTHLQKAVSTPEAKSRGSFSLLPRNTTSAFHWHAHGVSALHFTPNGSYLLSGGEEAVLVVWQVITKHKEFVPRLGGPISAVSITVSEGREQEFALRLRDGSLSFVGAGTLKVTRSIAGVKSASGISASSSSLPLAVEPYTSHLVFQAAHPSSIQFFSPTLQAHLHELDISPTNRVSRTDERELEPIRVEKVAFAPVSRESGRVWMATFDTWQDRGYSRESHLKFWIGEPTSNDPRRYVLSTRIDQPHGQQTLSGFVFSPSPATGQPKLATCSTDGSVKIWTNRPFTGTADGIWQCAFSLSYRNLEASHLAFSHDASLLAVAHPGVVTLWHTSTGRMVRALTFSSRSSGTKVSFVGKDGSRIVAGGKKGTTVWDVLTCEELLSLPEPADHLIPDAGLDAYTSTSANQARSRAIPGTSASEPLLDLSELVFPLKEATAYPVKASSSSQAIAGISKTGEVILTGPGVLSLDHSASEAQNLRALARTYAASDRPVRLFDEIFGASALPEPAAPQSVLPLADVSAVKGGSADVFAQTPTHMLPSIAGLASGLLSQGLKPLAQSASGKASTSRAIPANTDTDSEDEAVIDQPPRVNGTAEHDMDIDEPAPSSESVGPSTYVDSPAGLVEIFKKSIALAQPATNGTPSGPGTPLNGKKDPRLAGNDSSRKALKKKKSLSSMFGGAKAK